MWDLSTTIAILIHGRVLPALTLSQSTTVTATGKRHQDATRAEGEITFYNGFFTSQTIAAGTILTSADGVQIVTDEPASIPAGNPPIYGQVTVSAHSLNMGAQGNIQAYDINEACCLTSVLAKNTEAFTGGLDAGIVTGKAGAPSTHAQRIAQRAIDNHVVKLDRTKMQTRPQIRYRRGAHR